MRRTPRALWVFTAFVAVGLPTGSASASGKPKVLVLPYQNLDQGLPDDLGEETTKVVTREISHGEVIVIRADDVAEDSAAPKPHKSSDTPTGDAEAGAKAEAFISQAKEAMEDSDFDKAIKLLEKAVKLLEDNGDAVPDLRLLPEAYLQMGVAYFRDGREDDGDEMLNKAVHLDPERKLDGADYPPIFIRVFERARFNVLRRSRARIEVKAAPGAQVLFDGRNLGKAPIVLTEVLPGAHWLRVERPGEAVQVKKVSVSASKTLEVVFDGGGAAQESAAPVGVLGAIAANEVEAEHLRQLKAAGTRAGADFVMFGGIYKTDTAYHIHTAYLSVKDGSVGRLVEIAFDLDMLSAEIEVYKLAEDARNQAIAMKLSTVDPERPFMLAPKMKKKAGKRVAAAGQKETKLSTVVAAPAAQKPPESVYATASEDKAPVATKKDDGSVVKAPPPPNLLPKDEVVEQKRSDGAGGSAATSFASTGLQPKDDDSGEGESTWWIWVVVGVAVAGAAAGGGYLIASSGSPTEGNLTVSWGQE